MASDDGLDWNHDVVYEALEPSGRYYPGGTRRNCAYYAWKCEYSCEKFESCEPKPFCTECNAATQLKLIHKRCKSQGVNEVNAKVCRGCSTKLQIPFDRPSLSDMWKQEENRQIDLFIRGIANFRTSQQNMILLIYGIINHEIKDETVYISMPVSIVQECIKFCYDMNKVDKIYNHCTNKPVWQYNNSNLMGVFNDKNVDVKCNRWSTSIPNKSARLIWKIKILNPENNKISFRLGITNHKYHELLEGFSIYVKDSVVCDHEKNNVEVKHNDIVSVMLVQSGVDEGKIKFAINGEICLSERIIVMDEYYGSPVYKLGIIFEDCFAVEIVC